MTQALHHRSDALTSFIALLSILGSHAGLPVLDPLGGILVSLLLLKQSSAMTWRSTLDLLDASCSDDILRDVRSVLADLQEEAVGIGSSKSGRRWEVRSVKGLNGGAGARIELELAFITDNGSRVGLAEAEQVAKTIEERVKEAEGVAQVRSPSPPRLPSSRTLPDTTAADVICPRSACYFPRLPLPAAARLSLQWMGPTRDRSMRMSCNQSKHSRGCEKRRSSSVSRDFCADSQVVVTPAEPTSRAGNGRCRDTS